MSKVKHNNGNGNTSGTLLAPIVPLTNDWFDRLTASLWRGANPEMIKVEEVAKDDTLTIRAEVPGVDPDNDIDITVDNGMLNIKVERSNKNEQREEHSYRSEFRYGSFTRSIHLPAGTTAEAITATYRDGILEVSVPAPPATTTNKVQISK